MRATEFIVEAIVDDIDDDVDRIYDKFFSPVIDEIQRGFSAGRMDTRKIRQLWNDSKVTVHVSDLIERGVIQSPRLIAAAKVNPVTFLFFSDDGENTYAPLDKQISLSLNSSAKQVLFHVPLGDIDSTLREKANSWRAEWKDYKVKSSIHHELAHWLDDTENRFHLTNLITRVSNAKDRQELLKIKNQGTSDVNLTTYEIQGQIHNIHQLKRKFADEWDEMTIQDLVRTLPGLNSLYTGYNQEQRREWLRKLRHRMAREGLLGRNMSN